MAPCVVCGRFPTLPVVIMRTETSLCAGVAAAISVYTGRVPHARGAARPLRGLHESNKSGVSIPQELPVVIFPIKYCVSITPNTLIAIHPLAVYYLNLEGGGLNNSGGIGPVYAAPLYL
jgi:hypothetical protein